MTAKTLNNNCPSVQQVGAEEAPHCVDNVWDYDQTYFFVAPRATPKQSILPESTLVGIPLDCGAHAPSGGARPEGPMRTREGGSAAHKLRKNRSAQERENHVLRSNREQIDSRRKHLIISTTVPFLSVDGMAADALLLCSRLHRHVPTCLADGRAAHVIDVSAAL